MQLEKLLHSQGFGTRKECRALVRNGWLEINGQVVEDPFLDVNPEGFRYTVDDEPFVYREKAYLMLHKPSDYECSQKPKHHRSIYTLLPDYLQNREVQCVGRLDEDTTGLILITDDGHFIHRMSSPKHKVPKVYEVTAKHPLDQSQIEQLLAGVMLHDDNELVVADRCELVSEQVLLLTLTQGKYHQVKRMLAAVGNRVERLKRVAIGQLALPAKLEPGEWCWLEDEDLVKLGMKQA
ncbi:pseudouridine synthase [Azospira sp. I13]|uniref:pseudouridine synthase n=1 Tax=Azospira sp. I13 TaxID=1765050 RepID=UPI000D45B3CF|nr:pseudouridine synthase [Azospira sp. I13]GBG03213.1 pseudouridine synthase [Azospira sp. I13]